MPLLAHQNGRLVLIGRDRNLNLYFSGRKVICAVEDKRVLSRAQLEERLLDFLDQKDGSFEFFGGDAPPIRRGCIDVPVEELSLKLVTLKDELDSVKENLPLPDTVFTLGNVAVAYSDNELAEFLDRAWPYLVEGASARVLSRELGLPLQRVRYILYKLRNLNAVSPKAQQVAPSQERRGIAGRLLRYLKRRFQSLSWSL